jgi:hypothetical protein
MLILFFSVHDLFRFVFLTNYYVHHNYARSNAFTTPGQVHSPHSIAIYGHMLFILWVGVARCV